jgi:hypothetical protein
MTVDESLQVREQLGDVMERLLNTTRFIMDDDEDFDEELDRLEHAMDLVSWVQRNAGWL